MGSFNATCIISNLPIEAGTPVRFLALTRNAYDPDGNGHVCYVTGRWQLHGVPIKAQYNDYGSVENIEPSFTTTLFWEGLAQGAMELGTGDNQCHDAPVRADMNEEAWLDALRAGRVKVLDARPYTGKVDDSTWEPAPGTPSMRRIEKLLVDAGHQLSTSYGAEGYVTDTVGHGYIRVRHGRHGNDHVERLNAILPLIHQAGYGAMMTAGSGSYANPAEILVAPLPSTDPNVHIHADMDPPKYHEPRPVSQAMIREDVWQILLNTPVHSWTTDGEYRLEALREAALKGLDDELKLKAELEALEAVGDNRAALTRQLRRDLELEGSFRENIFMDNLRGSEGVSGFTFRKAFRLAIERAQTPEELRAYVLDLADTVYVQWVYSILHGQWHPTTNSGQDGNWEEHRAFLTQLLAIKGQWEEDEADEDDEAEDAV